MPDSEATPPEDLSFEEALHRLESIVETLEDEPPHLEDALDAYEEGVSLAQRCLTQLEQADLRVQELSLDD